MFILCPCLQASFCSTMETPPTGLFMLPRKQITFVQFSTLSTVRSKRSIVFSHNYRAPGAYRDLRVNLIHLMGAVKLEASLSMWLKYTCAAQLSSTGAAGLEQWYQCHPMKTKRSRRVEGTVHLPALGVLECPC